jgi:hypothetical protein
MARPPLRSQPPSQPSPYRYLGRGGAERPVKVQIIIALVAGLVLVAVPLYLWRRPQPETIPSADAATAGPGLPPPGGSTLVPFGVAPPGAGLPGSFPGAPLPGGGAVPGADAGTGSRIEVAPVKTLKCQDPGPGRTPPERCDSIRFFEESLLRAIRESQACAPSAKSSYVVSFVLEMSFTKKRTSLYMGKSTTLSKSKRKELVRCVERAMATPDWDRIPHQHAKYVINAVATYPPSEAF